MSGTRGVLIVTASLSDRGGLQRRVEGLANGLADHHPITVLAWSRRARPRVERPTPGIQVVVVPSLLAWDRDHRPLPSGLNTLVSVAGGALAALLLRRRWSVAIGVGLHPEGTVAALAAWPGRRRLLITTWLVGPLGNAARLVRSPLGGPVLSLLRRASWFVAETSEAKAELISLGFRPERITTIVAGIDLRRFAPDVEIVADSDPPYRAVYAGRFDLRQKRIDLLLDAWSAAALDGWELVLAGAGPDETEIRRRALAQGNVHVMGWSEDVIQLLRSSDCFVLASEAETSALGMLEAMACGLPGIVSATPGLSARHPDGVLLAVNEPGAWIEALRAVDALGPEGRAQAGRCARVWAQAHADADRSNELWLALLEPQDPRRATG
jgi:glycosyltransferase involved in cell wall biosynthesis